MKDDVQSLIDEVNSENQEDFNKVFNTVGHVISNYNGIKIHLKGKDLIITGDLDSVTLNDKLIGGKNAEGSKKRFRNRGDKQPSGKNPTTP